MKCGIMEASESQEERERCVKYKRRGGKQGVGGKAVDVTQQTTAYTKITFKIPFTKQNDHYYYYYYHH